MLNPLNKKLLIIAAALIGVLPAHSEELLENSSFEEFTTSSFMSIQSAAFTGWTLGNAFGSNVDSTDVIDGKYAFITNPTELKKAAVLYQSVDCSGFAVADSFKIRVCYKNLNDSTVRLCSYWTTSAGSEPLAQEPALNQELPYSSEWDTVEIATAKPEGARNFEFRVEVKAKGSVMFDNCSFAPIIPAGPYFTIIPDKNYLFTADINSDTVVAKIAIRQYNLTQPVRLEITGTGKSAYKVDKSQVTAQLDTVTVSFKATTVGKYNATLNINDDESPETSLMNRTVSFTGTAIDRSLPPTITITPMEFDTFRCKAYETVTDTFIVQSENCYDYVHVVVDDETGPDWAFGLSSSFFGKNAIDTVVITFAPVKAGNYTAKLIAYTSGITDTIRFAVAGVAEEGQPKPIVVDWDTTFVFNTQNAYPALDEGFAMGKTLRNKTLKVTDWQNVVLHGGNRPWWGFHSDSTTQAKITSYYYQADSGSVNVESWLVTPALDYKNAVTKVFSFRVMSDLIYKGQTGKLELYFIDPTDPNKIYFEHIQAADTLFPANDDELEGNWVPIVMDLSKVSGMPDVFYMAFRFTDKGGNNGVTYYITDVTWSDGITGMKEVQNSEFKIQNSKFIHNGQLYILKDGKQYNILGQLQ